MKIAVILRIYMMEGMTIRAEIITVGTELLLGDILNTNAQTLAKFLSELGIDCYFQTTVGDNPQRMRSTIEQAESRSEMIILCGGLGPTEDDLTKEILANHLGVKLTEHQRSGDKIRSFYQNHDHIPKGNFKQVQYFEGSLPLLNPNGMAVGIFYESPRTEKIYIVLPGPPRELKAMIDQSLKPILYEKNYARQPLTSRTLYFFGLTESMLGEKLSEMIGAQTDPSIAIYASAGLLSIRLTTSKPREEAEELFDQTEERIQRLVGEYFIGYQQKAPSAIVYDLLTRHEQTLQITETVTLGHVAKAIRDDQLISPVSFSEVLAWREFRNFSINEMIAWGQKHLDQQDGRSDYHMIVQGRVDEENQDLTYPVQAIIMIKDPKQQVFVFSVDHQNRQNSSVQLMSEYIADGLRRIILGDPLIESFEFEVIRPNKCSE